MMRYVFVPHIDEIPEWKQCYYDYQLLQRVQKLIYKCDDDFITLTMLMSREANIQLDNVQFNSSERMLHEPNQTQQSQNYQYNNLLNLRNEVYAIMSKWCYRFSKYSYKCSSILTLFVKMKQLEISYKYQEYKILYSIAKHEYKNILILLQNLYIQTFYLYKAIDFNRAQQVKITQQYQKFSMAYNQHTKKFAENYRLRRLKHLNDSMRSRIQNQYLLISRQRQQESYQILQWITNKNLLTSNKQLSIIGFIMGILALMITVLVMTDIINKVVLEENKIFTQHFPVWRGTSYILFYLWIIGIDVLFYQRSQINYRLIFQFNEHNMPESKYIFMRACVLSIIYIVLFYVFTLEVSQQISSNFYHYGAIFWLIIILSIFVAFPCLHKNSKSGYFYFIKLMKKIILTPCVQINFIIIWVTEQLGSFNQPFGDFFYTICYVITNNSSYCTANAPYASTAYILFILLYRMIQNLKLWHQNTMKTPDKKYDFKAGPFIGFFRGLFAFITSILALVYRLNLFNGAFVVWLVSSIITTLYSWYIDIKNDWGILDRKSRNCLRQKLLFPQAKFVYYFFAIFDLALRTAWVLTISSLVLVPKGFPTLIFTMSISYLQIFRRGVWNILRIQFEHVRNCAQFRATASDSHILKKVRQQAQKIKQKQKIKSQDKKNSQGQNIIMNVLNAEIQKKIQSILKYFNQQTKKQKELGKQRSQQFVQIFKQNLVRKSEMRQQILQQLKKDRFKLKQLKFKGYKKSIIPSLKMIIKNQ